MTKAELKTKWGKYCDTDKLVDTTMALLTKYHHKNTEHGVCKMLDTYFTNKSPLIDMFKKSEHYLGDMRIVLDVEISRDPSCEDVRKFCVDFPDDVNAESAIIKFQDEEGKGLNDYLKTGIVRLKASDLIPGDIRNQLSQLTTNRNQFNLNGETKASRENYRYFASLMGKFSYNPNVSLGKDIVEYVKQHKINIPLTQDMKTSRAFNRVCANYGVDQLPDYNKLFAKYSDMVSGLKRKLKFFISLNPLDYLTMSFGNSWASCHTIDKRNERHMPNDYSGAYCGGTLSYMLDKTSIITFVHDHIPTSIEDGKIYRNMFHYSDGLLIQGRIYPQGNDGATDLYKEFREIVHAEFASLLELKSNTWVKKNNMSNNYLTCGVHYADYVHFSACNATYPKEMSNAANNVVEIGHERICPHCGTNIGNGCAYNILTHSTCPVINVNTTTSSGTNMNFDWLEDF